MRLIKRDDAADDGALFLAAMTCGLIAAAANESSLVTGAMGIRMEGENAIWSCDLIEMIKDRVNDDDKFFRTPDDMVRAFGLVLCAAGVSCASECDKIGWAICAASCPEPAILSTNMGAWVVKTETRHWWADRLTMVNSVQADNTAIIEIVASALQDRGHLTSAEVEQIIAAATE